MYSTALKNFYNRIIFLFLIAFFFLLNRNISFPQQDQLTKNYRLPGIILHDNLALPNVCIMPGEKRKRATASVCYYYGNVLTPQTHVKVFNTIKHASQKIKLTITQPNST